MFYIYYHSHCHLLYKNNLNVYMLQFSLHFSLRFNTVKVFIGVAFMFKEFNIMFYTLESCITSNYLL